jgi:hypothetical protein
MARPPSIISFLNDFAESIAAMDEEPYQEYWKELGQFIHAFSQTEHQLLSLLRETADVSDTVAGVIFGGTRGDSAKDFINKILEATDREDVKTRLESPLAQFAVINTIRNHLVHWGARHEGTDDFLVSNAFLSPVADRLKEFRINTDNMKAMRSDLHKISLFFQLERYPDFKDDSRNSYLSQPWLYKPPQPSPQKKERLPHPPKQSLRRDASQKSQRSRRTPKP